MSGTIEDIESLLNHGRYIEARIKAEALVKESTDIRLHQLYALALSKAGLPEAAIEFFQPVYDKHPDDSESAGILGSICKELYKKNLSTAYAVRSRDTYLKNFSITNSYYTGINAASMSVMAGQVSKAREIANSVISNFKDSPTDFWELATLGEAYLLTKNKAKSVESYLHARKLAGNDWGKITSVYNQLWLLNHVLPVSNEILKLFLPPTVVAFIGHMIDQPSRSSPRFPSTIESEIKDLIISTVRTEKAHIGYCSVACGGDILFAEAMVETGGEVNIFIPFNKQDFINTSLAFAGDTWVNRFEALINNHSVNYITHEHYEGCDDLFSFQSKVIFGSAILRSKSHHADPKLITVLSEMDLKRKEGGTRDTLRLWPYPQYHININPDPIALSKPLPTVAGEDTTSKPATDTLTTRSVLYLLSLELKNVSALERDKIQKIVSTKIENESANLKSFEINEETILLGYESEGEVIDLVTIFHNQIKPFQKSGVKMGLHAGPVYFMIGADSKEVLQDCTTVNVVKLLSQFSNPGTICVSEHFASILALDIKRFNLHYAGVMNFGNNQDAVVYNMEVKSIF